jgi:hypothetical protein
MKAIAIPEVSIYRMASTAAALGAKGPGRTRALLEVLNVKAERSGDEHASDIITLSSS